jgi:hypothetical protein
LSDAWAKSRELPLKSQRRGRRFCPPYLAINRAA